MKNNVIKQRYTPCAKKLYAVADSTLFPTITNGKIQPLLIIPIPNGKLTGINEKTKEKAVTNRFSKIFPPKTSFKMTIHMANEEAQASIVIMTSLIFIIKDNLVDLVKFFIKSALNFFLPKPADIENIFFAKDKIIFGKKIIVPVKQNKTKIGAIKYNNCEFPSSINKITPKILITKISYVRETIISISELIFWIPISVSFFI
jgi:hypothetical protein